MPTYVYETIPQHAGDKPVRFEIRQSMKDAPLTRHPDSGEAVRRIPVGGTGILGGASSQPANPRGGSCGSGCGCH